MLVLFETAAGFGLFKLLKDGKLDKPDVSFVWEGGEGGRGGPENAEPTPPPPHVAAAGSAERPPARLHLALTHTPCLSHTNRTCGASLRRWTTRKR